MFTRRRFLQTTLASSAVVAFPAILRSATPNSLLHVAVVGAKGQGFSDLSQIGSHPKVNFTGFCDVDTARFDEADKKFPGVEHFQDFREMFAKLGDRFDAVQVSTPDHTHAWIALEAMKLGKHVYCQKPLTHTVWEARQMRLLAEKAGVTTQMGNQIHSSKEYRTAVKLIREGAIGKVKAVHSWHSNPGNAHTGLKQRPQNGATPPPTTLNWDLWLGPAPFREYLPNTYAPFKWRDWQDFGGGTLGDFGCHILDPVFTALELTAPLTIRAENDGVIPDLWPKAETVSYVFPGTRFTAGERIEVTWYDGGRKPDHALTQMAEDKKLPGGGSLFIGETGTMVLPHVSMPVLYPQQDAETGKVEPEKGANHYHVWVDAVLERKQTSDGFQYAGPLTEAVQLGNVATRVPGKELHWDTTAFKFPNAPEVERLLSREYRGGYAPKT